MLLTGSEILKSARQHPQMLLEQNESDINKNTRRKGSGNLCGNPHSTLCTIGLGIRNSAFVPFSDTSALFVPTRSHVVPVYVKESLCAAPFSQHELQNSYKLRQPQGWPQDREQNEEDQTCIAETNA